MSTEKICNMILPTIKSTYADSQISYKSGVALSLSTMAPKVGVQYCTSTVLKILIELLNDENSEVRLNVAKSLIESLKVVGHEFINAEFMENLQKITKDSQWRVKMAAFEMIGDIVHEEILNKDQFVDKLQDLFFSYLKNTAAEVRITGVRHLSKIA